MLGAWFDKHLRIIFLRLLIHLQNSQNFWAAEISSYTVIPIFLWSIPYSGLFSRRLYFANNQFNSCSRKVISRMETLNHASSTLILSFKIFIFEDWLCFREIREYKRLEKIERRKIHQPQLAYLE